MGRRSIPKPKDVYGEKRSPKINQEGNMEEFYTYIEKLKKVNLEKEQ